MLLIYDYLVGEISSHLRKKGLTHTIDKKIKRCWHANRYVQVLIDGWDPSIHYEYCNGHWELHFENPWDDDVVYVRKKAAEILDGIEDLGWHNWFNQRRGLLRLEKEVNDVNEYIACFDELYHATYPAVNALVTGDGSELQCDTGEDSSVEILEEEEGLQIEAEYEPPKHPEILSIADLPFALFRIPVYQRPYKWSKHNVNQLIVDILSFKEKSEYRLGTLVLQKRTNTPSSPLNIVDGQQRIITVCLLLAQLMAEDKFAHLFSDDLRASLSRFLALRQFNDITTHRHLAENITAIRHRISDFTESDVQFVLNRCKFVVITLFDISEAFQFFDSQNSRGKELEPHDLLKAFHLRAIDEMDKNDLENIRKWENFDTKALSALFLMLFRIKRWLDARDGKEFTSDNVDTFKGLDVGDRQLPYQKIYTMARCYTMLYNSDVSRLLDRNRLEYPHQIDQIVINGSLFFDMIRYYEEKLLHLHSILPDINPAVMEAVCSLNRGQGDRFIRVLFDAACLFYFDKFGEDNLGRAMEMIFAWAYGTRLRSWAVRRSTMDNMARGRDTESFFTMLHSAVRPTDVLNWQVPTFRESEIMSNQKSAVLVINLMKKLRYVE